MQLTELQGLALSNSVAHWLWQHRGYRTELAVTFAVAILQAHQPLSESLHRKLPALRRAVPLERQVLLIASAGIIIMHSRPAQEVQQYWVACPESAVQSA